MLISVSFLLHGSLLFLYFSPFLGVTSVVQGVKVGLGMALLACLVDVCHCAFSKRSVIGFLIDHMYNALVFVSACVSLAYFG